MCTSGFYSSGSKALHDSGVIVLMKVLESWQETEGPAGKSSVRISGGDPEVSGSSEE